METCWQKSFEGDDYGFVYSILQSSDGSYMAAGATTVGAVGYDMWIFKLDPVGNVVWSKIYDVEDGGFAMDMQETLDGGFIIAGVIFSAGGPMDFWVLKLDAGGGIVWQNAYGGQARDRVQAIRQTTDGGYIVAGETSSHASPDTQSYLVIRMDENGNVLWQKAYVGQLGTPKGAPSIVQAVDGGFILAGTFPMGSGYSACWVARLDEAGGVIREKSYGSGSCDVHQATSIDRTADNGCIVAGYSDYFGVFVPNFWVFKLDRDGTIIWEKTFGSGEPEEVTDKATSVTHTLDGGYIVAGVTDSFGAGGNDFWILKIDSSGTVSDTCPEDIGMDSSALVANTSVTVIETDVEIRTTDAGFMDANVTPIDTNAVVETQCSR